MINIAIVEDEKKYSDILYGYIKQFEETASCNFQITTFQDGLDIITDYKAEYDIIFLDIQMKHMNGMKAAEEIRKFDEDVIIIFVTSTVQFAVQGYSVNALGYVLKPVSYFAFSQILSKSTRMLSKKLEKSYLHFEVTEGLMRLDISQIYYVESQRHFIIIHSENGDYQTKGPLKQLEETISSNGFIKCHNSYLINLNHVTEVKPNYVIMTDASEIPISRTRKKLFMDSLSDFIGGVNK